LDSHGQQFSNKDLEELAKELSQQEEEEREDEEPPLNHMQTSDTQNILTDMETLTDVLCDNDHDWERSAEVKMIVMVPIGTLFWGSQRKKKGNLNSQHCMLSSK